MKITCETTNSRLDLAICNATKEYSRSMIQRMIKSGKVSVNGTLITIPKYQVTVDDEIILDITPLHPREDAAQALALNIVFEDEYMLIINKPAGLTVHPGAGQIDQTLLNALLYHDSKLRDLPQAGMVHRLDKDTTGLLIIAKDITTHTALSKMMHDRQIEKTYLALVHGRVHQPKTISEPIARHPTSRQKFSAHPSGRPSVTHFTIHKRFSHHTLLLIQLETGRTHQIRVHMEYIGHPLVGDQKYGLRKSAKKNAMPVAVSQQVSDFSRQALHAYQLQFIHPKTNEKLKVTCPLPQDLNTLLQALRP
ncbi:RluA family pseudouridine synthase [Gammaproteobacteria bacterium]|nr:RluA family pseudouridine synthase [Gammaproteobacteria bacterium]